MLLVAVCSIVIIVILTLCFISSGLVAIFLLSGMYVVVSLSTYSCMSLGLL